MIHTIQDNQKTESDTPTESLDYTFVQHGTMPIILTAPHGGWLPIPDIHKRENGTAVADLKTFELTLAISKALYEKTGLYPYIIAARFSRKYIDANRPAYDAYEDEKAKPIYDSYHSHIVQSIAAMKKHFPSQSPLLIDIHGQGREPGIIFRGTNDRRTIQSLLATRSEQALTGKHSILGVLAAQGHKVFPLIEDVDKKEHARFNGGFITYTYGSHTKDGIDTMQLEFGSDFRTPEAIPKTACDVALAIATFYAAWQKPTKVLCSSL